MLKSAVLSFTLRMIGRLPLWLHHFNALWISFLLGNVVKYRKKVVESNIAHAFPDKTEKERKKIVHEFYLHLSDIFVETFWFAACRNPRRLIRSGIVTMKGQNILDDLYRRSKDGVVIMSTHSGNWELTGGIILYSDSNSCITEQNYCVVHRELKNKVWEKVMRDIRLTVIEDKEHLAYLESKNVVLYMYRHRGEGKMYNMITDQRPYFSSSEFIRVNFMGREVNTMSAAAEFASRLHLPVVYQRMSKPSRGHYVMEYVPICEDASQMPTEQIMKTYFSLLEEDIRKQPFNYLWSHNRWK